MSHNIDIGIDRHDHGSSAAASSYIDTTFAGNTTRSTDPAKKRNLIKVLRYLLICIGFFALIVFIPALSSLLHHGDKYKHYTLNSITLHPFNVTSDSRIPVNRTWNLSFSVENGQRDEEQRRIFHVVRATIYYKRHYKYVLARNASTVVAAKHDGDGRLAEVNATLIAADVKEENLVLNAMKADGKKKLRFDVVIDALHWAETESPDKAKQVSVCCHKVKVVRRPDDFLATEKAYECHWCNPQY